MCATHKSYINEIEEMQELNINIHGLCHLTGGGFVENPKRILPDDLELDLIPFEYSDLFKYVQKVGDIADKDMQKIFNCGYGMLVFLSEDDNDKLTQHFLNKGQTPYIVLWTVKTKTFN